MADPPSAPPSGPGGGPRVGGALLGRLRALGDKIENVATNVAKEVVSGVHTGVTTVGTGVINVAKDIKDSVLDGDLDRIRSIHQLQKAQASQQATHKRKQVTEQELDAADKRADAVLAKLPAGYFEHDYDPVRHELAQLSESSGQEDMDTIVERLGTCVEAVSGKLSRHVMKKRDQLIKGIDVVASVEDDLKAALAETRTSRSTVRLAGEEVERHLRVTSQTRRKQAYMQVMEAVLKIQQARSLQKLLRKAQENGDYHQAIVLCVQCFQGIESLKELKVAGELLATVQRLYVDTLQKLDGALTAICGNFDPGRYTKVLDAYLLQNISGATLAERVLQSFKDSLNDATSRVAKSLLLTQPQLVSRLAGGSASLEGSFPALVGALPPELLPACLVQVLEVCVTGLGSFHAMAQWHVECVAVQRQRVAAQPPDEASITTLDFLASVSDMLAASRREAFNCAAQRMMALIRLPTATTSSSLLQVAEHCHRFVAIGEAFTGADLGAHRDAVGAVLGSAFEQHHHASMQALSALMQSEDAWKNVGGPKLASEVPAGSVVGLAELVAPSRSLDGQRALPTDASEFARYLEPSSRPFTPLPPLGALPKGPAEEQPMMTPAAKHLLRCLRAYGQLYRALGRHRAGTVWQATTQLFDRFLAATFVLMSGVSIDALVLQDELVTLRLQRVLLRILAADGSRYKPHIEELLRMKASGHRPGHHSVPSGGGAGIGVVGGGANATGISWLDRFGDKMESLANDLDRHVSKLSAAVADKAPGALSGSQEGAERVLERLVAAESLALVAAELKAGRAAIQGVLNAASAAVAAQVVDAPIPIPAPSTGVRLQYQGMQQVLASAQQQQLPYQHHPQQPHHHHTSSGGGGLQGPGGSDGGAAGGSDGGAAVAMGPPPMRQTTATLGREADAYFGRVVEAAWDLREAMLQSGTRTLLGRMLDPDRGVVPAVAHVPAYAGRDPPINHNAWAETVGSHLRAFGDALAARRDLPQVVRDQMWVSATGLVADALTTGFARVKKCTLEGRVAMAMDLSHVEKVLRSLLPPTASAAALAALRRADAYVRAPYLPWDEFSRFCQAHFAEYGLARLAPLVDLTAEVHKVKKQQRAELLELLEQMARDFAS